MKNTIRIEGGRYTSLKSAAKYIARGRAVVVNKNGEDVLIFTKDIRHFNPSTRSIDANIDGSFEWHPRMSAGFMVLQAQHTT